MESIEEIKARVKGAVPVPPLQSSRIPALRISRRSCSTTPMLRRSLVSCAMIRRSASITAPTLQESIGLIGR